MLTGSRNISTCHKQSIIRPLNSKDKKELQILNGFLVLSLVSREISIECTSSLCLSFGAHSRASVIHALQSVTKALICCKDKWTGHRCGGILGSSNVFRRYVNFFHLYTLVLLQTDSSPSLTLAQLAKVVLLQMLDMKRIISLSKTKKVLSSFKFFPSLFLSLSTVCFRPQTW